MYYKSPRLRYVAATASEGARSLPRDVILKTRIVREGRRPVYLGRRDTLNYKEEIECAALTHVVTCD